MIQIDRTRIPPPFELLKAAEAEADKAIDYYLDPNNLRYGKPFPHRAYRMPEVREALNELFHGKCAFCESKINDLEPGEFRPWDMVINSDGTVTKPGYWWLAWEWSNLYPICPLCNRTKANRFPVEGRRATFERAGSPKQIGEKWADPLNIKAMVASDQAVYLLTHQGTLLIWDIEIGKIKSETEIPINRPDFISITPDGRVVAIASKEGQIILWHISQRFYAQEPRHYEVGHPIHAIELLPDGKQVLAAGADSLIIYDIPLNEAIIMNHDHTDAVTSLTVSQDGRYVVTGSKDKTLRIWSLKSLGSMQMMLTPSANDLVSHFTELLISPDTVRPLRGHKWPVVGVRIAGSEVVSLSLRGSLRVWDIETGENVLIIEGDGADYQSLDLSSDGRYAICKTPLMVRIVDLHTRMERLRIESDIFQLELAAGTPNGKYVFTVADQKLETWHLDPIGGERALLLDPCQDQPADILIFSENGLVASASPKESAGVGEASSYLTRGQTTIDIFGLNRSELVEARREAARQLHTEILEMVQNSSNPDFTRLLDPRLPYTAMRQQLLPKYIQGITNITFGEASGDHQVLVAFEEQIGQYAVKNDIYEKAFKNLETLRVKRQETPIEDLRERDFFKRSAYITKIIIENFRCIHHLEFDFMGGSQKQASWKVLLGENGVGKSSILEAVALTLLDKERLGKIPEINKGSLLKRGARKGFVQVFFATENLPVELALTPTGPVSKTFEGLHTYLLGFGSARWLPGEGSKAPETDDFVRVRNLFNPFVPLTDAIFWLKELKETREIKKYQKVELVLTRLLQLEPGTRFPLRDGVIYVQLPGNSIIDSERLDEMSDGYQTILAIAITIMDMLGELWDMEMEVAEGLVLLDEIGAHLHPRWKMKIVDSLRKAFPRMQFLATTHEPLCLRGLYDNEILLLRKIEGRVKAYPIEESPDTLTTDQLLRSPLFGLMTTFDPDTDQDLERYSNILSKPDKIRTPNENIELDAIRQRLGQKGVLGEMARKQVVHSVLAESIPKPDEFDPDTASTETKDILKELAAEINLDMDI